MQEGAEARAGAWGRAARAAAGGEACGDVGGGWVVAGRRVVEGTREWVVDAATVTEAGVREVEVRAEA